MLITSEEMRQRAAQPSYLVSLTPEKRALWLALADLADKLETRLTLQGGVLKELRDGTCPLPW
jgi:hypothetical protein